MGMYLAGFIGADGSVGLGKYAHLCRIYQSSLQFNLAFAEAVHKDLSFDDPVKVMAQKSKEVHERRSSANSRRGFTIAFSAEQVERLCLTVGALDYNRAPQWLVTFIMR